MKDKKTARFYQPTKRNPSPDLSFKVSRQTMFLYEKFIQLYINKRVALNESTRGLMGVYITLPKAILNGLEALIAGSAYSTPELA